ncbi:MAG: c-type cytochrome [Ignavibacteriales bacterium]|nr:c-type cytochrome [Ignavibacteriales bacterium]
MLSKRSQIPVEQRGYGVFYIGFSAILFLGTVWAVWDEVSIRRPWKDYQSAYYKSLYRKLDSLKTAALAEVDSSEVTSLNEQLARAESALRSQEYREAVEARNELLKDLDVATREWRFARSRSDAAYYQYQKAALEGTEAQGLKVEVDRHEADMAKYATDMESLGSKIASLDQTTSRFEDEITQIRKEITALFESPNSYNLKLARAEHASLEIKQVMLPDYEFTPFSEIKARIDRCQTCHLGWAEDVMADAPQPFGSHPFPELLAEHNPETFGCTPCHRGQGPALTEGFAHGFEDHYWETPILTGVETYATCNSCHSNETVLKRAGPFTKMKQVILESGCYGCHEIKGYTDLPKLGPVLNALPAKTTPEWIFRWVRNPKEYNPHTRMPNFQFSDEDAEAVTAYLVSIGRESDYKYAGPRGSYAGGNAVRGKETFEAVGCQACHVLGDDTAVREERGTSYDTAPELTHVGSKVNPDWLFDWLKNPRHYSVDARMPSLRLSDMEARNLVAYLMSQKDARQLPPVSVDIQNPEKIARGDKLIREYGCAGCHTIKGMEKEGKVSVDLSDFGRKKVEQMDFGNTRGLTPGAEDDYRENSDGTISVKQTWAGWVYGKMKNPRLYATDRIVQKMPLYTFNDEEIPLLRTFLMSMTRDPPLANYQHPYTKRMQDIESGRRLSVRYNCIQCHTLEDRGGSILVKYEDPGLGPPPLPESQGAKVQEQWLHDFLKNPSVVRPWLKLRMPSFQFSDTEIGQIQKYFLGMSHQDFQIRDYAATPVKTRYLAPGKYLFDLYQCAKCHPSGSANLSELSASDLAPNLALASSRLKPEWIVEWIVDPQKLQPGTRMPTFFYDGIAPDQETLGGDPTEQANALTTYIWTLGKSNRR